MTDLTGSGMAVPTPPNAGWRKSRHSNPDGSCLEVTVLTGRTARTAGSLMPSADRVLDGPIRHTAN